MTNWSNSEGNLLEKELNVLIVFRSIDSARQDRVDAFGTRREFEAAEGREKR